MVAKGANITAAQSNLQTALTAAKTFYTDSNQTFTRLTNTAAANTSSIQSIDTGLSYVSGGSSTGPRLVSTAVSGGGTVLVLAAFANGTNDCWGILDVTSTQAGTTLGIGGSTFTGTYFFVVRETAPSACNASTLATVSGSSTSGFPPG
jgi:hypothetical protein